MKNISRGEALEQFERLAALARDDSPPPIDVADRVLARLQSGSEDASRGASEGRLAVRPDREWIELVVGAGLAITAAAIALSIGVPVWESMNDPLAGWFEQFNVVMQ